MGLSGDIFKIDASVGSRYIDKVQRNSLRSYLLISLSDAKPEVWRVMRLYVVSQIVVLVASTVVLPLVGTITNESQLPGVWVTLIWGTAAIFAGALIFLFYAYVNSMRATYFADKEQIGDLEVKIAELRSRIERLKVADMAGWEVIEYMAGYTPLTTKEEMEHKLREWAREKQLHIEAKPETVEDLWLVPSSFFKGPFSFDLIPRDTWLQKHLGCYGRDPENCTICGINDREYVVYRQPRFLRDQIIRLCDSLRSDT